MKVLRSSATQAISIMLRISLPCEGEEAVLAVVLAVEVAVLLLAGAEVLLVVLLVDILVEGEAMVEPSYPTGINAQE
jgi:hypothetical protein